MRVALLGHNRKFRVLPLLFVLALVIISSSFAGASVADAHHLPNKTVKTGVSGSLEGDLASVHANDPAVNLSAGEPSEVSSAGQGISGAPSYMNQSIWLGDFNGSYLQPVYIPVYSSDIGSFNILNQTFSYDPQILSFNGTLNDVTSQSVNFSYAIPVQGIIKVYGKGPFNVEYSQTVLYYLVFNSMIKNQTVTSVLLDFSTTGILNVSLTSQATVRLARGWTNLGPRNIGANVTGRYGEAGTVPAIGYSPYNLSVLYVASGSGGPWEGSFSLTIPYQSQDVYGYGGVFKSTDGGKTWFSVDLGLNSTKVNSIAVDPKNPETLVISTGGMPMTVGGVIYKSVNGGKSWQETYPYGGNNLIYYDGTLYAASYHAVLLSHDFGSTWEVVKNFSQVVTSMAVSNNGSIVLVGIYSPGQTEILRSTDYGNDFSVAGIFPGYFSVSQIIVNPGNGSKMMALLSHGYMVNPNLFNSTDGGASWSPVNDSQVGIHYAVLNGSGFANGYVAEVPQAITYDPANGSIIYVAGPGYVYKSTDGGDHFVDLQSGGLYAGIAGQDNRMINVDPLNDSILFIGSDQGLAISHNGGLNWATLNNRSASLIYTVAASGSHIFTVAQDFSPIFSNDSGSTWYQAYGSEEGWASVDPYNSSIAVVESSDAIIVSDDGGNSFFIPTINNESDFGYISKNVNGIVYTDNKNGTIYAVEKGGVFESKDAGKTFTLIPGSPPGGLAIALDPLHQNVLYVYSNPISSDIFVLYKSANNGTSWRIINRNIVFNSISIDPYNDSIIAGIEYIDAWPDGWPVISFDGGVSFRNINFSTINLFVASPQVFFDKINGKAAMIYTNDEGIYVSYNLGKSWSSLNYNIPVRVVSDFFQSSNGSSYISTYGSGVWYDPSLFVSNFSTDSPIFTGYLPSGSILTIDGAAISRAGYFSMVIKPGNNSIDWEGERLSLVASQGDIYFFNFSNLHMFLSLSERNLPAGTEWSVSAGGRVYSLMGNGTVTLPPGTDGIYVFPVATDYSIYYPSSDFYPISSSLTSSVVIPFNQTVRAIDTNLTSSMNGMFWSTQAAYNRGLVLYAGGGPLGLLNVTSNEASILQIPNYAGIADTVVPFGDGFLIGGSASPNRPGIYYYNISTHSFTNYSSLLPATWNDSSATISSIFGMNSSAFGFIGGGTDSAYFGIVDGRGFINLDPYLPSSFTPSNGWYDRYSGTYLSSYQGFVLSDGADIGIFYLQNKSFQDISPLMPNGFFVGTQGNEGSPSSDFISSNNSTAIISGTGYGGQFTVLYNPDMGIKNISSLFPSSEYMDTVSWHGRDIILSGHESIGNSSSIFIYNTSRQLPTEINTTHYGNTSLIDSAIMVGNSVYFTTFNVKQVPNQSYVILSSYYGVIKLTPTGSVNLKINAPSTIEINNESYYAMNATIPEFAGNYTLTVSSPGLVSYAATVDLLPFETLYLNVTLAPKSYGITFIEKGLSNGVSWSVTLNGTTEFSTSDSITFQEPNGTYDFSIGNITRYTVLTQYGAVTVNGTSVSESVIFTQIVSKGYFVGSVSPSNASIQIFINSSWVAYKENNGSFNISLNPGTYRVSVVAAGYATYSMNITITSLSVTHLPIQRLSRSSPPPSLPGVFILVVAVMIIALAAAIIMIAVRKRKR